VPAFSASAPLCVDLGDPAPGWMITSKLNCRPMHATRVPPGSDDITDRILD